ncbi:cytochrome c oxidase subunit II [Agrococcus sp. SL85]|uniref:aa3-type cytochrome oxidase subunit II n=1 Tax=Agrococcus sp. SL85 TaxID=2995141 RepID=UPI00226D1321|nr:cytochrome c oxidase subunit II [Agrococcus sp. SL85]WAC66144.1 cytochrome c oxidase subunit II [Agrococcus sp. SL85]
MRNRRSRWIAAPLAVVVALALAGCTQEQLQGYMPSQPGLTNHVDRIMGLWTTSWIVLLAVGVITWGLMIFAAVAYRRRKGQVGLPVQLRYHMPMEIFFTIVPVILVAGFFAFTARDQAIIEEPNADPDYSITVYGKRWSWDFVYEREGQEQVYFQGIQAQRDADGQYAEGELPTLVLPTDSSIEITLEARDVAHSFWIVEFLYKKDMLPGVTNHMYFETGSQEGVFRGKCAELCGEYHSAMLFNVELVSPAEYDAYLESLEAEGNVGPLDESINPFSGDQGIDPESDENVDNTNQEEGN